MPKDTENGTGISLSKGLPMFVSANPAALEKETQLLASVESKGAATRIKTYWRLTGPGWMQSAMTLGASSSAASLFAGALVGYGLLWVQPLAMMFGVIMLSAMVHQTLSTGCRPFDAMRRFIHPAFAWTWALAALLSTIIWHIPQYAMAAGMAQDMLKAVTGWQPEPHQETVSLLGLGFVILCVSVYITWGYGKKRKGVRLYERILKGFLWLIIFAFALVVLDGFIKGKIAVGEMFKGFIPNIPKSDNPQVRQKITSLIIGGFSGAVGINMTFLFPYTLLARGWSREHRGLGKFDLLTGMLIPYSVATGLIIVATGATLYNTPQIEQMLAENRQLTPVLAASMLEQAGIHHFVARIIFGMGILGMVMTTISMQMLVAGFAVCEMFKVEPGGRLYRWACLIPTPAFLGVLFWQKMSYWVAIPTAAICGILLPIAYIGFFLLNNNKRYLGEDTPRGIKAVFWNIGMVTAIVLTLAGAVYYSVTVVIPYCQRLAGVLKG